MQKITSRDNQKLKFARKVRDGKENDKIFVEGIRLAEEFLRSRLQIFECFVSESFTDSGKNLKLLEEISALASSISEVPDKIFSSLSDTKNSQGLIIIANKPITGKEKINESINSDFQKFPVMILLHQINNPSNLGAVLRTAEAVGVKGVILTKNSADVFSTKSIRAAMGAAFRLSFWLNADFEEVLEWAKEKKLTTRCADIKPEKSFWTIDWKQPSLLIFGSEAHGLTEEERSKIEESIYIPMEAHVESLNLAVSSGVILFEAKRNWLNVDAK